MKDPFKKIFEEHKEELFLQQLDSNHLEKFEDKLIQKFGESKNNSKNWIYHSGIAASILFIFTIGFLSLNKTSSYPIAKTEIQESEDFFEMAVASKIKELKTYENAETKPSIDRCLINLNQLNQDYIDLNQDYKNTGNNELMNLMLNNLKRRVDILENLINHLEHFKNQQHEI